MQSRKRSATILLGLITLGVVGAVNACSAADATGPTRPPIPSFAESGQCGSWSCSIDHCGYNPGSDPRGACCTGPTPVGYSPQPKPDCNPQQGNSPTCVVYTGCTGNYPTYHCTGFYTGPCNEV